jgi:nucleotide-binding universal stress UspA family protein
MSARQSPPRASRAVVADVVRPLRSILALADFSPKSDNAVARAALLAREHGTKLHLLHVLAPRRFTVAALRRRKRDDAEVALERAGLALAALATRTARLYGVSATCSVRTGDAMQVILEGAQGADLVVVAAKRPNPLRDFVLRTPTERLLRIVQRPMLIVKRPAVGRYGAMLVPGAEAVEGDVVDSAAEGAAGATDELVVVPKDGQAAMGTFLLGRLAQRLVAHAACDVLLLPAHPADRKQAPASAAGSSRAIEAPSRGRPRTA